MMRKKKIFFSIFISFIISCCAIKAYAFEKEDHNKQLEYVLFGDEYYKNSHPLAQRKIQALEDAVYLCVDQFNGSGQRELDYLREEKIPNLPKSINDIDFKDNYKHRMHTHKGWNVDNAEKGNWTVRKQILINTVDKELFSSVKSPSLFFWNNRKNSAYKKQCESFCVLIYYVHILGDHIHAQNYTGLATMAPLTSLNDRDNPGVIPDLIKYSNILFEDQINTYLYKEYILELEDLQDRSDKLTSSKGGVNTEEKFDEYHQCALDLLEVLAQYVPVLLSKESFFKESLGI